MELHILDADAQAHGPLLHLLRTGLVGYRGHLAVSQSEDQVASLDQML
jgi:hypothetical protein